MLVLADVLIFQPEHLIDIDLLIRVLALEICIGQLCKFRRKRCDKKPRG